MKNSAARQLFPPHLSMDEYVAFIEAAILDHDPRMVARQKSIEENIMVPFRIHPKHVRAT